MEGGRKQSTVGPGPELVFVLPAYNEEANLPRLLDDLASRTELMKRTYRVVIVDDGSQDSTAAIVDAYEGPCSRRGDPPRRKPGAGCGVPVGFDAALRTCSDDALIVTLESDSTSDLDALPSMLERAEQEADLVLASWLMQNVSAHRRFMSAAAGFVVRRLLHLEATTVSSFFRVYRATILRRGLERYGDHLVEERGFACKAELLAKLTAVGARVEEVEVDLDWTRRTGKSKMPVVRTILCYWRMIARLRSSRATAPA